MPGTVERFQEKGTNCIISIFTRATGYGDLADRLVELQYELTDRLIMFIGGRRPDHKSGPHIVLPEIHDKYRKIPSDSSLSLHRSIDRLVWTIRI